MSQTLNLIIEDWYVVFPTSLPFSFTINYLDGSQFDYSATINEVIGNLTVSDSGLFIMGPSDAISSVIVAGTTYDFDDENTLSNVQFVGATQSDVVGEIDTSLGSLIIHQEGEFG